MNGIIPSRIVSREWSCIYISDRAGRAAIIEVIGGYPIGTIRIGMTRGGIPGIMVPMFIIPISLLLIFLGIIRRITPTTIRPIIIRTTVIRVIIPSPRTTEGISHDDPTRPHPIEEGMNRAIRIPIGAELWLYGIHACPVHPISRTNGEPISADPKPCGTSGLIRRTEDGLSTAGRIRAAKRSVREQPPRQGEELLKGVPNLRPIWIPT